MAESRYYFVEDVMAIMEIKQRKAYDVIREMNDELKVLGKITIPGRIPKSYFHHRTDIEIVETSKKEKPVRVAV